ncbi:MAG: hypothetical protein P4L84_28655 [Isosphaeraceae bacterium]|nr:hypothetical protein [Isosphaeraceae bacterium]
MSSWFGRTVFVAWALLVGLAASPAGGPPAAPAKAAPTPTFTKDVAPILQRKCQNCHRRHHVGPFSLETYEQARKRAADIASVVEDRRMPPWKPAPGVGPKLKHDQSLTRQEIATLGAWAHAGAPEGEAKDMPPPAQFATGWKLGPPDLVLEPTEDFPLWASGPDTYRCFVLPTNLAGDAYVSALEFQPSNRRIVHHINAFLDISGDARRRDEAEPGIGYTSFGGPGIESFEELTFWAAGHEASRLPLGIGQRLLRQCDVVMQVHYHPSGKPEVDRTRIGVYFSREPVKQALHWNRASNSKFQIAAGETNVEVKASWFVPADVEALGVSPHMHQLGRDMRISVTFPNGRIQDLIQIPAWDPTWQSAYYFQQPIALPQGSVVNVVAHFDNSAHPRNPNQPPKRVKSGSNVSDEMCEGFIAVVKKGQDLTVPRATDDLTDIFAKQRIRKLIKEVNKGR